MHFLVKVVKNAAKSFLRSLGIIVQTNKEEICFKKRLSEYKPSSQIRHRIYQFERKIWTVYG